jgi:2-polyprenyl-6-methoxyphenol hydroxylase-like FAD-dependent oxidoreductase
MAAETVLISGIGIAGPTLAFWLRKAGFAPTLVERAPSLRSGGYVIDFWGLGYDIAERMALAAAIDRAGYHVRELRMVDRRGRRVTGFGTTIFDELTDGRYVTIGRSDLSRLIVERVTADCELIFDDEIVALEQEPDGVQARLRRGGNRRFDLVVGADGLHSAVRRLAFGPQARFEKPLGYRVAAFESAGYRPRDEAVYTIHTEPGLQLGRFALHDDRTLFLFVFVDDASPSSDNLPLDQQKALLRERFGGVHWESARILEELDRTQELYFDRVSQIAMDQWSKGRIALLGDAAFCISLLGGQGSALAMTAAYVLAGELAKSGGSYEAAFANYETVLRDYIVGKQRAARRFAGFFAPNSRLKLFLLEQAIRMFRIPGVARYAVGRDIVDSLKLPDYRFARSAAPVA